MRKSGLTILECLVGMTLSFFVVCSSLAFFGFAQKSFFNLKEKEETGQAFLAALDKIKVDLLHAGQGLVLPFSRGALEPVTTAEGVLTLVRASSYYALEESVETGDVRLPLQRVTDLREGREICVWDENKGEVREVALVDIGNRAILVTSPLEWPYIKDRTSVALLETIHLFLDERTGILRRRVNLSSAQPLLENVKVLDFEYERGMNLVSVRLEGQSQGGRTYGITVFPKNSGAAAER